MVNKAMLFAAVVGLVVLIDLTSSGETQGDCKPGCRCCNKEISSCLKLVAGGIEGYEPLEQEDQSICKIVSLTGLSTIVHNNISCIKEVAPGAEGKCYSQVIQVKVEKLEFSCQLHSSPQETLQVILADSANAAKNAMMGAADSITGGAKDMVGKMKSPFGKRSANTNSTFYIKGTWEKVLLTLNMYLCFDDDIYNVTDVIVQDQTYTGMSLWCEGGKVIAQICGALTKPDFIRKLFGWVVHFFAKFYLGKMLNEGDLKDNLASLNCGEASSESEE